MTRKIRVAHVIETLGLGGAERVLTDVVPRLDPEEFDNRVFPLDAPLDLRAALEASRIEVEPIGIAPSHAPVRCTLALGSALRRFRPDIVHTHLYFANVIGRIAARCSGCRSVVSTLHNPDYTFEARPTLVFAAKKSLDRWSGRRNAALIAVSRAVADDYRRHMRWHSIQVIPNGVDTTRFSPGPAGSERTWWPAGQPRLLSVGRLHPQKGHDILLDAVGRLRDRGVSVGLLLVGQGPLRAALQKQIERLAIADRVRLHGQVSDVLPLLRASDLFVFPSRYEAAGLALLEAMACGRAVLASRTGGIPEIVEDGVSGRLCPPGLPDELANELQRLVSDSGDRERLAQAARKRAVTFDVAHTALALARVYTAAHRG